MVFVPFKIFRLFTAQIPLLLQVSKPLSNDEIVNGILPYVGGFRVLQIRKQLHFKQTDGRIGNRTRFQTPST
jgi:hypothetical protein